MVRIRPQLPPPSGLGIPIIEDLDPEEQKMAKLIGVGAAAGLIMLILMRTIGGGKKKGAAASGSPSVIVVQPGGA